MWHVDLSSRLATTDMGRNLKGCAPWGVEADLTQYCPGRCLYHRTKWRRKLGALPLFEEGDWGSWVLI